MTLADGVPVELWDGVAPGSESWTHVEQESAWGPDERITRNVVVPTLTPFLPDSVSDRAVIVCPGGALHFLAMTNEGVPVAEMVRRTGVAAFLLKYRVVPTPADDDGFMQAVGDAFRSGGDMMKPKLHLAVADAVRALEMVRAEGYRHVTLLGFSAGARITAEILVRGEPVNQPDAAAAIYLPSIADCVSPADPPPLFVLAAADDPLGIAGSLDLHAAWRAARAPVELHLYERGGHGFGTKRAGLPVDGWPDLFLAWLRSLDAPSRG